jgi:phosphohistidine phosphatase SixA
MKISTCVAYVGSLAALLSATSGPVAAQTRTEPPAIPEVPATKDTLKGLRTGGYVIYIRHANTDTSKPDAVPKVDLKDCGTQRNLNDEGRKLAASIGRRITGGGIPVGEVIHSPFCRTRETAQLAFNGAAVKLREEPLLAYPSNMTEEEKKPVLDMTRQLLSAPVAAGTNRVLVGHAQNLADVMNYFLKPEGATVIIRPKGDGRFEYVASIQPAAWADLQK